MQQVRGAIFIVGFAFAAVGGEARSWGNEGHQVVALIARDHLAPSVRRWVEQLLAEDTDPLTASDIASRANWADAWRRDHPETASWHYVNLELDHPDLRAACRSRRSCVVDKINDFASELANPEKALREVYPRDPAGVEVETWAYDPGALTRGDVVDKLSLYLSLRDHPDERVGIAAAELLETFEW